MTYRTFFSINDNEDQTIFNNIFNNIHQVKDDVYFTEHEVENEASVKMYEADVISFGYGTTIESGKFSVVVDDEVYGSHEDKDMAKKIFDQAVYIYKDKAEYIQFVDDEFNAVETWAWE